MKEAENSIRAAFRDQIVSEEDFDRVTKKLRDSFTENDSNRIFYFTEIASRFQVLFPGRIPAAEVEDKWQTAKKILSDLKDKEDWFGYAKFAARLKVLYPNHISELNFDDLAFAAINQKLQETQGVDWSSFSSLASRAKIIFPDRAQEFNIDDASWSAMLDEMQNEEDWFFKAYSAADLKIVDTVRFNEVERFSQDDWESMDAKLMELRQDGRRWRDFVEMAYFMKVLSSQSVKVTHSGVELT